MRKRAIVVIEREKPAVDSVHDGTVDKKRAINAKKVVPERQTRIKNEPCVKEEVVFNLTVDQLVKDAKNCRNQKLKQSTTVSKSRRKKHANELLKSKNLVTEFKEETTKPNISLTGMKNNLIIVP
jgi:P2-related tail formation protein